MSEAGHSVRFVESARQIAPELWDACFAPPLEGRWLYQALEDCGIEDQFAWFYAVVWRGATPVGIAPGFVMNVPIKLVVPPAVLPLFRLAGVLHQRTLFVGGPCADEGTIGLLPDVDRRAALASLQDAFDARARELKAPMLVWKDFPDSCAADLEWLSRERGLFPLTSFPGTAVRLPGPGKEEYFASLKGSRRHILRKKLRRSAAKVAIEVEIVSQPDARTLDEIFGLFWQTYEKATTRFEKLNRCFFEIIAREPRSRFIVLREKSSGAMAAFMLCFDMGPHIINKFIGIDYRRPRDWLLYFRLWEAAVDWALSRGATSIQSGQTGYAPKIETGHGLVPLTNYCRHQNPLVHRVYGAVARTIGWRTLDPDLARFLKAHPETPPR
jgi:hypothetical protein